MIEIKKQNKNLYSLYPFSTDNWENRIYFKYLIEELKVKSKWVFVKARRPVNDISNFLEDSLNECIYMYIDEEFKYFDFLFYIQTSSIVDKILDLLYLIWGGYEHKAFIFSDKIEPFINLNTKHFLNLSWDKIALISNSYILFRGAEENVLWIGKSDELNFPDFQSIW